MTPFIRLNDPPVFFCAAGDLTQKNVTEGVAEIRAACSRAN